MVWRAAPPTGEAGAMIEEDDGAKPDRALPQSATAYGSTRSMIHSGPALLVDKKASQLKHSLQFMCTTDINLDAQQFRFWACKIWSCLPDPGPTRTSLLVR